MQRPFGIQANASELCFQDELMRCGNPKFDAISISRFSGHLGPIASPEARAGNPSDRDLQRAEGSGQIVVTGSENGTRIKSVFQKAPIRVLFPNLGSGAVEEAVLINIAGGTAGGDRLEYVVKALAGASIAVTSQAAEKVYRALSEPARITTKLNACEGAKLAWLPQETIVFNWARLTRKTEIELTRGAEMLALEWVVLGRAAHGEEMLGGHITDSWRVKKDGQLVWADCFRVTDDVFRQLRRPALLWNCKAFATLVYFGPSLDKRMGFSREIAPSLQCDCAATSVAGLMIVRFAAEASSHLRSALRSFLEQLSKELGPGPFRVPKMWSC
jgi:urease accessory protein